MQKKIIALAVAGLVSGAAFAQSNVTIYGVVDAGYVNSSGDKANGKTANFGGIQSGNFSGSRIGFKGEEALGNGLKAVFTLEYALNIDDNSGVGSAATSTVAGTTATAGLQARQQFVGLNSAKLGQVALGRQYAPGYGASIRLDPFEAAAVASPLSYMQAAAGNTIYGGSAARINNSVTYTSPNFSGFKASAIYGFGETATNTSNGISVGDNGIFGAGLNYANGPLNLDAVYQTRQGTTVAIADSTPTQDSVNEWLVGGSYDFKIVKVFASYQDQNDNNGTSATQASNKVWSLGASVPVFTNGSVLVSYSDLSWDRTGAGDSDAWALGYTHSMSKRTTLYTSFTMVDNDRNAAAAAGYSNTRAIGEKNNTFSAGVRHTF